MDLSATAVEIAKLELKPTDILVVKVAGMLSKQQRKDIGEAFKALPTNGAKVAVMDSFMELVVIEQKGE